MKLLNFDILERELAGFLRLLTNTNCIVCGNESEGYRLCRRCIEIINAPPSPVFLRHNNIQVYYYGLYKENLRDFIIAYKYHNHHSLSKEFSQMLYNTIQTHQLDFDIIAYVPATKSAKKKRGYDHMRLIAKALSKMTNVPCVDTLTTVRDTDQLTTQDRQEAVKGKFKILDEKAHLISGKRILLIDDVYTTGSTMKETYNILKSSGADTVIPLVIAMNR